MASTVIKEEVRSLPVPLTEAELQQLYDEFAAAAAKRDRYAERWDRLRKLVNSKLRGLKREADRLRHQHQKGTVERDVTVVVLRDNDTGDIYVRRLDTGEEISRTAFPSSNGQKHIWSRDDE